MKKIKTYFTCLLMVSTVAAKAQLMPEAFIGNMPPWPQGCTENSEYIGWFMNDLLQPYKDKLDLAVKIKSGEEKENAAQYTTELRQYAGDESGLTPEEIQLINSGKKLNAEQKKEMVDKVLQQNNNMTYDEVKKGEKMNDAAKAAWGQAYTTEQMAVAELNADKAKADFTKNMSLYEMTMEMVRITTELQAHHATIETKFSELDSLVKKENQLFYFQMKTLHEEYDQAPDEKKDLIKEKMINAQTGYCAKFTPKYRLIMDQWLQFIKGDLKNYYMMEQLTEKLSQQSGNVKTNIGSEGLTALKEVQRYMVQFLPFKYTWKDMGDVIDDIKEENR